MALLGRYLWTAATVATVCACALFAAVFYPRNVDLESRVAHAAERKAIYQLLADGSHQYLRGEYAQALETFERALAEDDTVFQTHNVIGLTQLELGDLDAAYTAFDRACRIWSQNADALNSRGAVRWLKGDRRGARSDFAGAVAQRPEFKRARTNLALAEFVLGNRTAARRELDLCLEGEDDAVRMRYAVGIRATLDAIEKNYAAADTAFALLSDPKLPPDTRRPALHNRAKVLEALGETDRAGAVRAEYEKLLNTTEDANTADSDA